VASELMHGGLAHAASLKAHLDVAQVERVEDQLDGVPDERDDALDPGDEERLSSATEMVGMAAAMMFGMVEMAIEGSIHRAGFLDGFWSPVKYIAAVFTRGADTDPTTPRSRSSSA